VPLDINPVSQALLETRPTLCPDGKEDVSPTANQENEESALQR